MVLDLTVVVVLVGFLDLDSDAEVVAGTVVVLAYVEDVDFLTDLDAVGEIGLDVVAEDAVASK